MYAIRQAKSKTNTLKQTIQNQQYILKFQSIDTQIQHFLTQIFQQLINTRNSQDVLILMSQSNELIKYEIKQFLSQLIDKIGLYTVSYHLIQPLQDILNRQSQLGQYSKNKLDYRNINKINQFFEINSRLIIYDDQRGLELRIFFLDAKQINTARKPQQNLSVFIDFRKMKVDEQNKMYKLYGNNFNQEMKFEQKQNEIPPQVSISQSFQRDTYDSNLINDRLNILQQKQNLRKQNRQFDQFQQNQQDTQQNIHQNQQNLQEQNQFDELIQIFDEAENQQFQQHKNQNSENQGYNQQHINDYEDLDEDQYINNQQQNSQYTLKNDHKYSQLTLEIAELKQENQNLQQKNQKLEFQLQNLKNQENQEEKIQELEIKLENSERRVQQLIQTMHQLRENLQMMQQMQNL